MGPSRGAEEGGHCTSCFPLLGLKGVLTQRICVGLGQKWVWLVGVTKPSLPLKLEALKGPSSLAASSPITECCRGEQILLYSQHRAHEGQSGLQTSAFEGLPGSGPLVLEDLRLVEQLCRLGGCAAAGASV